MYIYLFMYKYIYICIYIHIYINMIDSGSLYWDGRSTKPGAVIHTGLTPHGIALYVRPLTVLPHPYRFFLGAA